MKLETNGGKRTFNGFAWSRRLAAAASIGAMTAVFFVPSVARWLGWLPRLQLVPAILAGAVLEIAVLAVSVALFGRLYCSVLCPLGIVQDLARLGAAASSRPPYHPGAAASSRPPYHPGAAASAAGRTHRSVFRYVLLGLFLLAIPFGSAGLAEPYGIFGRFVSVGIRRVGEPGVVAIVWALGLVAAILVAARCRARFWCNRVCPVGTFLGLFSRFAVFRVRIDAASCVTCGACAARCAAGALSVRADRSIAVDHSLCVVCGNCSAACPKGALTFRP